MAFSPLIPIAGAALGSLAIKAVAKVSQGLSFADVLHRGEDQADEAAKADDAPAGLDALLASGGSLPLQDLQSAASAALEKFQKLLSQRLAEQGIDLSQPLELKGDGFGGVDVVNDHPQRAQIEQFLADNPELAAQFNALSSAFGLQRATQEHQALSQLYEISPDLAKDREKSRANSEPGEFHLKLQGVDAEILFQ